MTKLIDVQNIEGLFSYTETCVKNYIIDIATDHLEKVNQRKDEFNINIDEHFNIFTAIAEKYRHENLHSDLLKVILGNEKNNIGNREIFSKFLDYINIDDDYKNEKEAFISDYDSIKFQREYPIAIPLNKTKKDKKKQYAKGRIDLLIFNEEACIIIENKINGAPDQENQLGKYYIQMGKLDKKQVLKIVYLTIEEKKLPDNFDSYNFNDYKLQNGSTTKSIREEIKKVLINLPCVKEQNKEQNVKTFTEFLEEIKKLVPDKEKKTFIKHYKSLIESIGGKVLMIDLEKELIKNIMTSETNIQAVKMLIDTWNVRPTIIGKLLVDEEIIQGFKRDTDDSTIRQREITEKVSIYYSYTDPENDGSSKCNIEFGFRPTDNFFTKRLAKKLQKVFKQVDMKDLKFEPKGGLDPEDSQEIKWVYAHVDKSDLGDFSYNKIKSELVNYLKKLESEAKKALNSQQK